MLTDNGKQFTDWFGQGGEVLFDRICRENGIAHRLTQPASPTTTGKVERFHQTLRRELLDDCDAFESLGAAQAALDGWVESTTPFVLIRRWAWSLLATVSRRLPSRSGACWVCGCLECSRWFRSSGRLTCAGSGRSGACCGGCV